MKFLVDENLPEDVADLLRGDGHDAVTVHDLKLVSAVDATLADLAKAEGRAVVTLDVDFGNTQLYPPEGFHGLVVLRLGHQGKTRVSEVMQALLPLLKTEELEGKLWVVEDDRIRIR